MARDVSILISAKDNFSTAIKTMRNANTAFRKDMEDTQRKLDALNNTKAVLKVDTKKAQDALKEAEKQFAKTGDAADELKRRWPMRIMRTPAGIWAWCPKRHGRPRRICRISVAP